MKSTSSATRTEEETGRRLLRAACLLFGFAVLLRILGIWDPDAGVQALPELCVFHRLTGIDCPGCGMTRAFLRMAHGDWAGAIRWHPFSLPLAGLLFALAWGPQRWWQGEGRQRWAPQVALVAVLLLLSWWLRAKIYPLL